MTDSLWHPSLSNCKFAIVPPEASSLSLFKFRQCGPPRPAPASLGPPADGLRSCFNYEMITTRREPALLLMPVIAGHS